SRRRRDPDCGVELRDLVPHGAGVSGGQDRNCVREGGHGGVLSAGGEAGGTEAEKDEQGGACGCGGAAAGRRNYWRRRGNPRRGTRLTAVLVSPDRASDESEQQYG